MTGSWEIQPQVLVVTLTREIVSTAWAIAFRNLHIPGTYTFLTGMPFDHARDTGVMKLLEYDFDYVFFLDDDTAPPPDAILRLMSHNLPIVSGLYYRRSPPIFPVMLKETEKGRSWITEFQVPSLIEVDYVGAGCLLIQRNVLLSLPPITPGWHHWFEWRVNRDDVGIENHMSEDFSFCKHARVVGGHKIYVDTGVQCKHIGLGKSEIGGQFTPLEVM